MTYSEYKNGQTKKAVAETAAMLLGANPAIAAPVAAAASNPGVAIPAAAVGGVATGVKAYQSTVGNKVDKAFDNLHKQTNDTAQAYRKYLQWRKERDQKLKMEAAK